MQRRLAFELKALQELSEPGFNVVVTSTSSNEWVLSLRNITDTPYEDGVFDLQVSFPQEYPFKKPSITFLTRIYHPNISETGSVCLGILSDEGWSASCTIKSVLLNIVWLLRSPEVQNPSVPEIADVYISNLDKFTDNARKWVTLYAKRE